MITINVHYTNCHQTLSQDQNFFLVLVDKTWINLSHWYFQWWLYNWMILHNKCKSLWNVVFLYQFKLPRAWPIEIHWHNLLPYSNISRLFLLKPSSNPDFFCPYPPYWPYPESAEAPEPPARNRAPNSIPPRRRDQSRRYVVLRAI